MQIQNIQKYSHDYQRYTRPCVCHQRFNINVLAVVIYDILIVP